MNTLPQNVTIPKKNHVSINFPKEDSNTESCMPYSNCEQDNVQEEYYYDSKMDDDVLPQPLVSSLNTLLLITTKISSSLIEKSKVYSSIGTENMNKICSFRLNIE